MFNSRLQPVQIALGSTGTGAQAYDLLKLDYGYGTANNGNVLSQTITVPNVTIGGTTHNGFTAVQTYNYDPLNRLKQATEAIGGSTSWQQTFTFDRYGNRNFDEANTTTLPKECNNNTEVCEAIRPIVNPSVNAVDNRLNGYLFDNAGNTTRDAESRRFTYDGENKQVKVETVNSGGTVTRTVGEYVYDGDGKRVKKRVPSTGEVTVFVYDAVGKLIAEHSTIVTPPQDAKVAYLTHDHLGSPRILTDQFGAVISRRDFRPYGEEIARTGDDQDSVREKFATYERDTESGLDYAQARYYSANLGRFFSIDPDNADADEEVPQSWNAFSYARNNPLKCGDPSGEGVEVCSTSGERNCVYYTEKQWKIFLEANKESGDYTIKGTKIYLGDDLTAVITSSSFLDNRQMQFIRTTAEQSEKKGKFVGKLVAGAAVVGVACGLTAGAGCAAVAGAALREGVRRASPAAIQELAAALRFTGTTALRQANPARRVPMQTLATAILTGQRMADPQRAQGAIKIVQEMWKNGVKYKLEIIYREADKTILHFLYKRGK